MWILPTLNRPIQCAQVIDRLKKHGCSTPGVLFVNTVPAVIEKNTAEIDREIQQKIAESDASGIIHLYKNIDLPIGWEIIINQGNAGLCGAMNRVFNQYPNENFYGLITDDEFVCSDGWDKTLAEAASDWNISHGNNGWQSDRRIHGFMTIGGNLAREVGYLMPQGLWHWYSDDVWETIANAADLRKYCRDVKIENRHWMLGNAKKDKTYELSESRNIQDNEIFLRWRKNNFPIIKEKILNRMGNPKTIYAL